MDWQPEQLDLGALGFAGICREIFRVLLRAILPSTLGDHGAFLLCALLLAHIAGNSSLVSLLDDSDDLVHLVAGGFALSVLEAVCIPLLLMMSFSCTAFYVLRIASLYCTDGDSGEGDRILQHLPRAPVRRLGRMFRHVVPFAVVYILCSGLAWSALLHIDAIVSSKAVVLALQVLGGSACLASAAYVAVVSHVACVVAMLEDAVLLGAVRKSRALLAGKFWAAAAVFVPLDGCVVALHICFLELVLDDALGLGSWFQVAAGVATAVALWAVVVVTLAAQPVVYLVCKNYHNEVVDKVHLNLDYIGDYQRLDVDGDSGVELQPVETTLQPTATSAQATDQSPAGSST